MVGYRDRRRRGCDDEVGSCPKRTGAPTWRARTGTSIEQAGAGGSHRPRCRMCSIPFAGAGGWVARHLSRRVSLGEEPLPPMRAGMSDGRCRRRRGRRLVPVRGRAGSSELARRLGDRDFTRVMQRFYETATTGLFDHDALLGKIVGTRSSLLPAVHGRTKPRVAGGGSGPGDVRRRRLRVGAGPLVAARRRRAHGPVVVGFVPRGLDSEFGAQRHDRRRRTPRRGGEGRGDPVTEAVGAALETSGLERRHLSLRATRSTPSSSRSTSVPASRPVSTSEAAVRIVTPSDEPAR